MSFIDRRSLQVRCGFATETATAKGQPPVLKRRIEIGKSSKKVACIGAGPASLAFAGYLALEGHEVRAADNGQAGLALADEKLPDVVLIDIGLPDMDGYEVARRLRSALNGRRIGLVALTGFGQPEDQRRAFDAGFDAHLVKPVSAERLKQVIAELP